MKIIQIVMLTKHLHSNTENKYDQRGLNSRFSWSRVKEVCARRFRFDKPHMKRPRRCAKQLFF